MKKCLRVKCQKEFEPNKPKQVFCSAKCRVYFSREEKENNGILQQAKNNKPYNRGSLSTETVNKEIELQNLNKKTNLVEPLKPMGKENSSVVIKTDKLPNESSIDYRLRMAGIDPKTLK